ncbi:MAG TPA: hypothetical protein VES95_11175 [Dermatophilaceae bacterium]|nr:hypothetical protein [Dermatophilaceae bacterium]
MGERRDPELTDEALEREIELVGDFVVAASEQDGPLSESDIDRILGITAAPEPPKADGDGLDDDRDDDRQGADPPPG